MNHDTTPTPRTDTAWNSDVDGSELEIVSKHLERELTEKTNEVERLRELLERAIENCECDSNCSSHIAYYCDCGRYRRNDQIQEEYNKLTK